MRESVRRSSTADTLFGGGRTHTSQLSDGAQMKLYEAGLLGLPSLFPNAGVSASAVVAAAADYDDDVAITTAASSSAATRCLSMCHSLSVCGALSKLHLPSAATHRDSSRVRSAAIDGSKKRKRERVCLLLLLVVLVAHFLFLIRCRPIRRPFVH